eukprot:3183814-Amphidinium_carterae.1
MMEHTNSQLRSQLSRMPTALVPKQVTSGTSFRAASRMSVSNPVTPRIALVPHEIFSNIITTVSQADFTTVKMLVDTQRSTMME